MKRVDHGPHGKPQRRLPAVTRIAKRCGESRAPIGFRVGTAEDGERAADVVLPDDTHVMTLAPTGAGKGVNCAIPVLLQYPGPVIAFDAKGELAAVTARRRKELGQEVFVVDPFRLSGLPVARFNPLDVVEPGTADAADDARSLAEMLMPTEYDSRDVFWRNRGMHFLTAAIVHAVTDHYPSARNLVTVRDIMHRMSQRAAQRPNEMPGMTAEPSFELRSRSPDVARLNALFDLGSRDTVGGMLHTALEGVGFVRGSLVQDSLSFSDFSLDDVTEGRPMTIYLVMPPHLIASHVPLLRLWIGTLFSALMRRNGKPEMSTLLLLDEAAQLGHFPQLRTAVTLLRGYGLQTWSFWQDPSQLMQIYPQDWQSLVNNCGIVQLFGRDPVAAARRLEFEIGAQAEDARAAASRTMLILQQGEASLAERIDYRVEPAMKGMFDPNPLHRKSTASVRRPRIAQELAPETDQAGDAVDGDGFRKVYEALRALM